MEIGSIFNLYEDKRCGKSNGDDADSKYYSLSFMGFHNSKIWFFKDLDSPALMVLMAGRLLTGHLFSQIPQPMHCLRFTKGNWTANFFPLGPDTVSAFK